MIYSAISYFYGKEIFHSTLRETERSLSEPYVCLVPVTLNSASYSSRHGKETALAGVSVLGSSHVGLLVICTDYPNFVSAFTVHLSRLLSFTVRQPSVNLIRGYATVHRFRNPSVKGGLGFWWSVGSAQALYGWCGDFITAATL